MRSNRPAALVILAFVFAILALAGGRGFRTQDLLVDHYARHGHEFGKITMDQYLHMAQQLRDARPGKNILQAIRPDKGGSKFDVQHGWFVAWNADRTIRTFFVPNDGVRYFERQARHYGPTPE